MTSRCPQRVDFKSFFFVTLYRLNVKENCGFNGEFSRIDGPFFQYRYETGGFVFFVMQPGVTFFCFGMTNEMEYFDPALPDSFAVNGFLNRNGLAVGEPTVERLPQRCLKQS